ncbi:MAG: DUF2808 domain-containing protein [Cyanobacteria bacterium P01_A01_bin.114]
MTAKRFARWCISGLAIAATFAALPALPGGAQTGEGLTIWGGVDAERRLPYRLFNNEPRSTRAHYFLRVPSNRVDRALTDLRIIYPDAFNEYNGRFSLDEDDIKVHLGRSDRGEEVGIDEVVWTPEANQLDIYLLEQIPEDTYFTVVLRHVRNPDRALQQPFGLYAPSPGAPLNTIVGIWNLSLGYDDGR